MDESVWQMSENNYGSCKIKSLWPCGAIWWHKSESTLAQVMERHYLIQCWLIISEVQWHSSESNFKEIHKPSITKYRLKITYLKFHSNPPGANELTLHPGYKFSAYNHWMILFQMIVHWKLAWRRAQLLMVLGSMGPKRIADALDLGRKEPKHWDKETEGVI